MKIQGLLEKSNFRSFLLFLLLTTLVAIVMKLAKEYEASIEIPVVIQNVPSNRTIIYQSHNGVEVTARLTGFHLLQTKIFSSNLMLDFKNSIKISDSLYSFNPVDELIEERRFAEGQLQKSLPSQVYFKVDSLSEKRVSIEPQIKIKYESGFWGLDSLELEPNYVTLYGPKAILDTINTISTVNKAYSGVNQNIDDSIRIAPFYESNKLRIVPPSVHIYQEVTKFTEYTLKVPIEVINYGENNVKVYPNSVNITFSVPLERYETITQESFQVIGDFKNDVINNDLLILKVVKKPTFIQNMRLETKQVRFITINK